MPTRRAPAAWRSPPWGSARTRPGGSRPCSSSCATRTCGRGPMSRAWRSWWDRWMPFGTRPRRRRRAASSVARTRPCTSSCRASRAPPTARPTRPCSPTSSPSPPTCSPPRKGGRVQPVFTAAEMRALDARAIEKLGVPGAQLMENAGRGGAAVIIREWAPIRGKRVTILCGKGNNGGDGFVVARHLKGKGARARVLLLGRRAEVKGDAAKALRRWRGRVEEIKGDEGLATVRSALTEADIVVDALLGTGLSGAAHGLLAHTIELVNDVCGRGAIPVIALDLPSGLASDGGLLLGPAVRADLTLTFAGLKRALLLYPAAECAGRVVVVPIGIAEAEVGRGITTFLLEESDVRGLFSRRRPDAHKGTYGHLLVVAGSLGKSGAAALAGTAALRSGVGLCTVATATSQQPTIAGFAMELMTEALRGRGRHGAE